jgi:hypothetical protein
MENGKWKMENFSYIFHFPFYVFRYKDLLLRATAVAAASGRLHRFIVGCRPQKKYKENNRADNNNNGKTAQSPDDASIRFRRVFPDNSFFTAHVYHVF